MLLRLSVGVHSIVVYCLLVVYVLWFYDSNRKSRLKGSCQVFLRFRIKGLRVRGVGAWAHEQSCNAMCQNGRRRDPIMTCL